jgi:hypothetical protein
MSDDANKTLTDTQVECFQRILSDAFFQNIASFRQDKGVLSSEVQIALSTLTKTNSKIGAAVVVQSPLATIELQNVPGSPVKIRISFRVLEDPLFNGGASGTGKAALEIARHLVALFHLYASAGLFTAMIGEEPTIVPVEDPIAPVAYEVRFATTEARPSPLRKVAMQRIEAPDGTASPATATFTVNPSSAVVWYTIDGSLPYEGNAAAEQWDGVTPVAIASACSLRAVAFKDGYIPSDCGRLDFT